MLATVLFTDIVGSTTRADQIGDRRWRDLLDAHHAGVRRELARYRGRDVKSLGDRFLATFDGPARAVRCACAMRCGLHTGEIDDPGRCPGILRPERTDDRQIAILLAQHGMSALQVRLMPIRQAPDGRHAT